MPNEKCIEIMKEIIGEEVEVNARIEIAHRTGRPQQARSRHILFRVGSIQEKVDIL